MRGLGKEGISTRSLITLIKHISKDDSITSGITSRSVN